MFNTLPNFGQLSLFALVLTDDKISENKPSILRHSKGKIIYKALTNVGTSSSSPRFLIDQGSRTRPFRYRALVLPDDGLLSQDIQSKGYMVAWSDHYLGKKLGHLATEFTRQEKYYQENDHSKPWPGEGGWQNRIENWQKQPKPRRTSFLRSSEIPILAKKTDAHKESLVPQLWSMVDGWTAEVKTLAFLYAFTRLVKPAFAMETGTRHGSTASGIGKAMQNNGFGKQITLVLDKESYKFAANKIAEEQLESYMKVLYHNNLEYIPGGHIVRAG